MFRWFRRQARGSATAVLLAMLALGSSSVVPHAADHDEACAAGASPHTPFSHRIGTTTTHASHHDHCAVCHWARSFRPDGRSPQPLAIAAADDVVVRLRAVIPPLVFPTAQPPLRSPPAAVAI